MESVLVAVRGVASVAAPLLREWLVRPLAHGFRPAQPARLRARCDRHPHHRCRAAYREQRRSARRQSHVCGGGRRDGRGAVCRYQRHPQRRTARRLLRCREWRFPPALPARHPRLALAWAQTVVASRAALHPPPRRARTLAHLRGSRCQASRLPASRVLVTAVPAVADPRRAVCSALPATLQVAHSVGASGANRRRDRDDYDGCRCGKLRPGARLALRAAARGRIGVRAAPGSVRRAWVPASVGCGTSRTVGPANRWIQQSAWYLQASHPAAAPVRVLRVAASAWRAGCH